MLFIFHQIFKTPTFATYINRHIASHTIPYNFTILQQAISLCEQHKFGHAWKIMMDFIWKHPSGVQKGMNATFTIAHHVFLESENVGKEFYRCLTGIWYLKHHWCKKCGYWNCIVYNPFVSISSSVIDEIDGGNVNVESYLHFRHFHESRISICVGRNRDGKPEDCGNERLMWYSIIDVGLMIVISLEDLQFVKSKNPVDTFNVLPHIVVRTLSGNIQMDLFATVNHKPAHWVCTSMVADSFDPVQGISNPIYYYDDLTGKAVPGKLSQDMLNEPTVSGLIYLKRNVSQVEDIKVGTYVQVSNDVGIPIVQGTVEHVLGTHSIIKITSATPPYQNIDQFKKYSREVSSVSAIGSFIFSSNSFITPTHPPLAKTKKRRPLRQKSDSEGEADLGLLKTGSRSKRAQRLR